MVKVAVVGACGGIGQPLSLLIKLQPAVSELALYDVFPAKGVATELAHIPTPARVTSHTELDEALQVRCARAKHYIVRTLGVLVSSRLPAQTDCPPPTPPPFILLPLARKGASL